MANGGVGQPRSLIPTGPTMATPLDPSERPEIKLNKANGASDQPHLVVAHTIPCIATLHDGAALGGSGSFPAHVFFPTFFSSGGRLERVLHYRCMLHEAHGWTHP